METVLVVSGYYFRTVPIGFDLKPVEDLGFLVHLADLVVYCREDCRLEGVRCRISDVPNVSV